MYTCLCLSRPGQPNKRGHLLMKVFWAQKGSHSVPVHPSFWMTYSWCSTIIIFSPKCRPCDSYLHFKYPENKALSVWLTVVEKSLGVIFFLSSEELRAAFHWEKLASSNDSVEVWPGSWLCVSPKGPFWDGEGRGALCCAFLSVLFSSATLLWCEHSDIGNTCLSVPTSGTTFGILWYFDSFF